MSQDTEHPTVEDFEALEARATEFNALDNAELDRLRAEYHLAPPAPYYEKLRVGAIAPDLESYRVLGVEIDSDPDLSPEQRYVLHHELYDRWHSTVISLAGEGFND